MKTSATGCGVGAPASGVDAQKAGKELGVENRTRSAAWRVLHLGNGVSKLCWVERARLGERQLWHGELLQQSL